MRRRWSAACGPNGSSGSSPSTRSSSRKWVPPGADRDRPEALRADQDEADPGMVAERRDQQRVERLEPLQGDPAGLAREADQAEAARGHHRELGHLAPVRPVHLLADLGVERHHAVVAAAAGRRADRARRDRVVAGDLGQAGAEVGERVVLALLDRDRALRVAGRAHQVLERFPVAVAEGLPLRLAVVGEDDQPVGARSVGAGEGDPGDLAVEVAQHGEGVVAFDPGVVGDLVVGEEGRVDERAAGEDVADDAGDLEVALDDGGPGAHGGVGARAGDPRTDVVAELPPHRPALAEDVDERQHERARDRVGTSEVGRVVDPDRPPAVQHRAHRQHRVRRVAGEDVGAAGAARVQQPAPVRVPPLQLFGVARVVGDDRRAAVLLPPAEGRHVLVGAVQQARLAGAGLRGPVGLPPAQPVGAAAQPGGEVGRVAGGQRPVQDVVGEPVDLQEEDARHLALHVLPPPPHLPADDVAVPGVVFVDRQQRVEARGERRHRHRDDDPLEHPVEVGAGQEVDGEGDENAVEEQGRAAEGEDRERQRDPRQDRPDQRVEQADRRRRAERGEGAVEDETGEELGEQQQGEGVQQQDQQGAPDDPNVHRRPPRSSRWPASSAALTPMNAPASTSAG